MVEEAPDEGIYRLALAVRKIAKRRRQARRCASRDFLEVTQPGTVFRFRPRLHRAFLERQGLVWNDTVHIEIDGIAETLATRASAHGRVEAEQDRLGWAEFRAAGLALELLVEAQALGRRGRPERRLEDRLARFAIAELDGIDQPLAQSGADRDAVHQHEQ